MCHSARALGMDIKFYCFYYSGNRTFIQIIKDKIEEIDKNCHNNQDEEERNDKMTSPSSSSPSSRPFPSYNLLMSKDAMYRELVLSFVKELGTINNEHKNILNKVFLYHLQYRFGLLSLSLFFFLSFFLSSIPIFFSASSSHS